MWITFEYWDFVEGYFIEFILKYSEKNLEGLLTVPGTRNIKIVNTKMFMES